MTATDEPGTDDRQAVADEPPSTALGPRAAIEAGGVGTVAILSGLATVDELDNALLGIFAPEIQDALGISTTGLAAIGTASGAVFVAGAIPIARLADRTNRSVIAVVATVIWSASLALLGFVQNVFQFVLSRVVTGLGKSNTLPIHGSILADAYPEEARGSVYAIHGASGPFGRVLGPLTVALLTIVISGDDAWRTIALIAAIPPFVMAGVAAVWLREPERGAHERERVLGSAAALDVDEQPIAMSLAFERIRRIATFDRIATGIGVIGFTIFSVPIFVSLVLEDHFGLSAGQRGVIGTVGAVVSLVAVPVGATIGGKIYARDPALLLRIMGVSVVVTSALLSIAVFMPNAVLYTIVASAGGAISSAAFVTLFVIVSSIVPANLRAQGFSLIGVYVFLIGGFFGSIVAGIVADSIGTRPAIPVVLLPAAIVGGVLIASAGRTVHADMQRVSDDLIEAASEQERRARTGEHPVLQVKDLHVSIGTVPILHGIDLEVNDGEILAIVGTNGSGKSTLLRSISGLQSAERGVIRFGPTDITLQSAHARTRAGIVQLAGGRSSFGPLTVRENFEVGGLHLDDEVRRRRVDEALELFPELDRLLDQRADRLSGGEQQMLGLARALLLDPDLLLIDELSLGLAPVVVGRLVGTLDRIRADGTAIVIVEQSLNVAAATADRVVFLDRGRVLFDGAGDDLLARPDLARAVFLGGGA